MYIHVHVRRTNVFGENGNGKYMCITLFLVSLFAYCSCVYVHVYCTQIQATAMLSLKRWNLLRKLWNTMER